MTTRLAPHGTLSRHKHHGCKCDPCRQAGLAYQRRRYRQVAYGTWQPLTDAQPVREHIAPLVAGGYTIRSIATAAHTDMATVARVLYGPSKQLRTQTAQRLLDLTPDDLTPSDYRNIDATGTRRRLQALMVLGWPLSHVGRHIGIHPRRVVDLIKGEQVYLATARRVETGYRQLIAMQPADHGVPQNQVTTARRHAQRNGWHGPLAWDDIDNPDEQPETDSGETVPLFRARAEDGLWLERQGYTRAQAAERLGITHDNLQACISRARKQGHLELEEAA